jgi:hypothetical protein
MAALLPGGEFLDDGCEDRFLCGHKALKIEDVVRRHRAPPERRVAWELDFVEFVAFRLRPIRRVYRARPRAAILSSHAGEARRAPVVDKTARPELLHIADTSCMRGLAIPSIPALLALTLLAGGCSTETHNICGTWPIREIPNDTWTFGSDGRFSVTADNAPYDTGTYELTTQTVRRDLTIETARALRLHLATENTPPYAITWLDANRLYLSAERVSLTLYR